MPAKLDRCVEAVLARKSFKPGMQPDQRKSAAYAICTSSLKRNHDIVATLCQMPDDVDIELDENGNVRFHDVEHLMSDDAQAQECDEEPQYSITFDEKAGQDGPHVFFAPCRVIVLADKKDDKAPAKKDDKKPDAKKDDKPADKKDDKKKTLPPWLQ